MRSLLISTLALVAAGPALAQSDFPEPPMGGQMSGPPPMGGMRPPERETLADMKARMVEMFDRVDANHDGAINASELAASPAGRMLSRADMDGNGLITKAEMEAGADAMFKVMDKNGDGVITADERPQRPGRPD
ncbi:MAG: EF-hand domain-containing protein [Brevundimonas sp.]|uniref:EF-hand domain-containing protein n=1 Tax=Brevundimonas sp. TaxID=1871086 RepID=UPI0027161E6C|nr:EF-hand domain-containing protein [Brevundimonas sp.]MDO9607299.1 EF-hand domain-containing protein [Brevundimonas sp.]